MTPTSYIECNKPRATFFAIILVVGTMLGSALTASAQDSSEVEGKWQSDWILEPGYSAEVDTQGYSLPTAIAFVPSPGDRPEDPLYYVTELRGSIKVVTNDRKVHEFASDFFDLTPLAELPEGYGQVGMRERAEALGGAFESAARPALGWRTSTTIPLGRVAK